VASPLKPPRSGPLWLHEIKRDGFRVIACKDGAQVRLLSRPVKRFPLLVETLACLVQVLRDRWRGSCLADGGSNFDFIRYRHLRLRRPARWQHPKKAKPRSKRGLGWSSFGIIRTAGDRGGPGAVQLTS
jgi:hypothetical protein